MDELRELNSAVIRSGFKTRFRHGTVQDLALWMLELSKQGLERRDLRNDDGVTEDHYLLPLQQVAESGQTFAELLIQNFTDQWQKDIGIALQAMCMETFS